MKKLVLMLCVLAGIVACSKDSDAPGDTTVAAGRTVIVYMSGENSLSPYVTQNLNGMLAGSKQLGSDDCLLVYIDRSRNSELPWMARIRNGQVTDSISLSDMGISTKNEYASDPNIMESVLKYAVSHYPASRDYGLVLWGHSTGWIISSDSIQYTRAYGVDNGINSSVNDNGMWLNIPTLARVLRKLPHMKYIFADCCMFMCLESLYELRDVADYIIGSAAEIPQNGAPYATVAPALFDRDNFTTKIIDNYYAQKNGPDKNLDLPLVAVKMSEMDQLAKATRTALQSIKAKQTTSYADLKDLIYYFYNDRRAFYNAEYSIFHDAGDFIRAKASEADYNTWKQALDKAVVKKTYSAHWYTSFKWDTFFGNNFKVTAGRQSGVSMYVIQDSRTGYHATYQQDLQKFAWYNAVLK